MSFLDAISARISHFFHSDEPAAQQPIPITRITLPPSSSSYQAAPARVATTTPRGSERVLQGSAQVQSSNSAGNGIAAGLAVAGIALLAGATGGMALLLGGAAFLVGCGPAEENPNLVLDLPDGSTPVTQNEFCMGTQRLVESRNVSQANIDAGPQGLNQFPGIRQYLEAHLPEGLSLNNALVATNPADPQYVYVMAHTPDGAPLAEVGTSNVIFRFQRTSSAYAPLDYPRSLPLNGMHNALYNSFIGPVSMAYLTPEDFRNGIEVGGRHVNLSNILTSNPVVAIVFNDPQDSQEPIRISFLNYQSGEYVQIPGSGRDGLNVCSTYGEITRAPDASSPSSDATAAIDAQDASIDVPADSRSDAGNADVRDASGDVRDANRDSSSDRVDASSDRPSDAGTDARVDASSDAPRG